MKLQSISQPLQNICAFASQSIRNHPIAAAAVTTLFFATLGKATAQSDLKNADVSFLGTFTDWLAKDTAIKIGSLALVVITAVVLWKATRPKAPVQVARTAEDERVRTAQIKKTEQKRPGSAPEGKTLPRPNWGERKEGEATIGKGQAPRALFRAASDTVDLQSFQRRRLEHGVAETPGGINLTPYQMKENGEAALRSTLIYSQEKALLSYTLAANSILLGKLHAAKAEGIKGYRFVEGLGGDIKTDLSLLIQQCKFLISSQHALVGKRAEGASSQMAVPETPGAVNLSPLQMKEKGEAALRKNFTPVQHALLCYTLAADLMIEGQYQEAKIEIKKGIHYVEASTDKIREDLIIQYHTCRNLIAQQVPHSNHRENQIPSRITKALPIPPQGEDEHPNHNGPIPGVPPSQQQTEFRAPPPPIKSLADWEKEQASAPAAVEAKRPILKNKDAPPAIDPSKVPPPPNVALKDLPANMAPPPTPSKLPPPPAVRASSSSVDGVDAQPNRFVLDPSVLLGSKQKLHKAPDVVPLEDKIALRQELELADPNKVVNPKSLVLAEITKPPTLKKAPPLKSREERLEGSEDEAGSFNIKKILERRAVISDSEEESDDGDWVTPSKKTIQTPAKSRNGNNVVE